MGDNDITTIGDPSDVTNVNPYTDQTYNLLNQYASQAGTQLNNLDALGNITALSGIMPEIQGLVGDLMGPYAQTAEYTRDLMIQDAMRNVAGQYGDANAINSGAALSAMTRGAALPAAQTAQQLAQMQMSLGSQLGTQFLNQRGQQYQAQAGLLGGALGGLGSMGQAEWWQPTYNVEDPEWQEWLGAALGGANFGMSLAGG